MAIGLQSAGPTHDAFAAWSQSQGVVINGVQPARIDQHGLGIVASKPVKAGTVLVQVPIKALLTTDRLPKSFIDKHDADTRVHALLASYITNGAANSRSKAKLKEWQATWPSYEDFEEHMPALWPRDLRKRWSMPDDANGFWPMPCAVGGQLGHWDYTKKPARKVAATSLLERQERKLEADFQKVLSAFPSTPRKEFVHSWMIVNTRSFFYDLPLRREPRVHEDKMILCPFVDYFNHAESGCHVGYDLDGYTVTADRDYRAGEEIFVSYGSHDSDTLWVEYGFVPQENCFDCLPLDPWVLAPSTGIEQKQSARLKKAGYLDEYHIVGISGIGQICHRTQVAVSAAVMKPHRWLRYVRGQDEATDLKEDADRFIVEHVLLPFKQTAINSLHGVQTTEDRTWASIHSQIGGPNADRNLRHIRITLELRWEQINRLISEAIEHIHD